RRATRHETPPNRNLGRPDVTPARCGEQLVEFGLGDDNGPGNAPTVIATGPSNASMNVSINKQIAATFSRAMAPATINDATFTVRQGTTAISGTISYSDRTATFRPT